MNMIESIKTCFSKYASFNGRAIRSEYWWWILFITIVNMVLMAWAFAGVDWSAMDSNPEEMMGAFTSLPFVLYGLFTLAILIPTLAVGARRLHDTGKSGWWQLIMLLSAIPFVGIISYIVLIYFWVQKSQEGENKYG
jgi:uncharacterized membrane protein YhaH (DUF805 family)